MQEILDYLRELSLKDPSLEFFLTIDAGKVYEFRDCKPFLEKAYEEKSLSIRYLNAKGLSGISYTLDLSRGGILEAIERARFLSEKGLPGFYPELSETYPEVEMPPFEEVSREKIGEILEEVRRVVFSKKEIKRLEKENLSFGQESLYLIRKGKVLSFEVPQYSFLMSVVAESKKRSASTYAYQSGTSLKKIDFLKLAEEAVFKARALSLAEKGASKRVSVLFPPETALDLLSILAFSFKGDEVFKGRSFLKDKLGKKVFSEKLTLLDNGLYPEGPETRPFDDEGVPQRKTILVKEGVVEGFIWDSFFGKESGRASTGNARRPDPSSPPKVDFTNFFLEKGKLSKRELLTLEKEVFYVLEVLGAHTANPISGDFSFGVSGILYREGEEAGYLSEMGLSGNIFELFKDLEVGEDLTFFGDTGSPSLLFPSLDLG